MNIIVPRIWKLTALVFAFISSRRDIFTKLRVVGQAYSCISLNDLSARLGLSLEQTIARVRSEPLQWSISTDALPQVFPVPRAPCEDGSALSRQLEGSTDRMQFLASVVAHLEAKPVVVDLAASGSDASLRQGR